MLDWATQIQALEQTLLQAPDAATAGLDTAKVLELTQAMGQGIDANNDGRVDPIPGEGGAQTLVEHAQLMGSIELLMGQPQPVPAALPTVEPTLPPADEPTVTPPPPPTATPELIDEHAEEPASEHDGN
jgi:hypothetical protein